MRAIVMWLLVVGCVAENVAAAQSSVKPASGKSVIRACSLLTRDLVAKYYTFNPKVSDLFKQEE